MYSVCVAVGKRQTETNQPLPGAKSGERGLSVHSSSKKLLSGRGHDYLLKGTELHSGKGWVLFGVNYTSVIKKKKKMKDIYFLLKEIRGRDDIVNFLQICK